MSEKPKITIRVDLARKRQVIDTHGETFVVNGRKIKPAGDIVLDVPTQNCDKRS